MPRLTRPDFAIPATDLAQTLLGCTLVRITDAGERLAGVIVETEAYLGPEDKAAHSYNNRRTPRTEPMFGPGGTAYVYFTYGMHHCMNIVAAEEGDPKAVLIRALEPTEGIDTIRAHRAGNKPRKHSLKDTDLCSGPAKLCQALALDRAHSGLDLASDPRLFVESSTDGPISAERIVNDPRIGIGSAQEWVERPLRWSLRDSPHVSVRPKPADRP